MAYLPVPAIWKVMLTIPMDKKLRQFSAKAIVNFARKKSSYYTLIYPRGGAWYRSAEVGHGWTLL